MPRILLALLLFAPACAGHAPPVPRAGHTPLAASLDSIIVAASAARELPGLAAVVMRGDDTVLARGYGRLEITRSDPVQPTTVFQLGSISKQMLAALVVALADEKRIALDDPVIRYLPELSLLSDSIRIHHLLSHTSGIRELFMMPEAGPGFDDLTRSRAGLDSLVRRIPVDFAAGTRWSYSNTNYSILAMLVERVTGTSYDAALRTRFFQPLGLHSFRHCSSIPATVDAQGHEWVNDRNTTAAPENMNWIQGDGGLCANAVDLARWTRLLHSGRVLSAAAYARMLAPTQLRNGRTADYGFGLASVRLDDVKRIAHGGAMRGFTATAAYYPDSAFTVIVLTNRGNVRTEAIERALGRRLHGLPMSGPPNVSLPGDQRARYLGIYDVGVFDVRVVDRGGTIWLESPPPGPTTALRYVGDGRFVADPEFDAHWVDFSADGTHIRLHMGTMYWYGTRRPGS